MASERTLSALIVVLAAALRLVSLDTPPFSSAEAERGLTALALVQGHVPEQWDAPALHTISAATVLLFGASEVALRAAPALAGTLAVALVWLFRPWLTGPQVMTAQLLMAVSPSLVTYSRTLGPEAFALALLLLLVWSGLRLVQTGTGAYFSTAAVCGGLLLNLGPAGLSGLLALSIAPVLGYALGGRPPALRGFALEGLIALLIAFTLGATGLLLHPAGFGLPVVQAWTASFDADPSAGTWSLGLLKLALYEPAALVAGACFGVLAFLGGPSGSILSRVLAVWAACGTVLLAAQGDRGGWTVLSAALPLTLLAGAGIGEFLAGLDREGLRRAAVAAPLPAVVLAYLVLAATRTGGQGGDVVLIFFAGAAALALAAFLAFSGGDQRLLPSQSGGALALAFMLLVTVHTTARLAYAGSGAEWFDGPRPSGAAASELDRLSLLPPGAPPVLTQTASISVSQNTGPLVHWLLRDRGAVTYVDDLGPGPSLLLGLRPGEGRAEVRGYRTRDFPLESSWRPVDGTLAQLWRWYFLRETFGDAPLERRAVVYWRT